MTATEFADKYAAVLVAALSWLGTPFEHNQAAKGAGVDCVRFLAWTFYEAGLVPHPDLIVPAVYPSGVFLRRELYLDLLRPHVIPREGRPQPADIVSCKVGKALAHAAIVLAWPQVIHAHPERGVIIERVGLSPFFAEHPVEATWTVKGFA